MNLSVGTVEVTNSSCSMGYLVKHEAVILDVRFLCRDSGIAIIVCGFEDWIRHTAQESFDLPVFATDGPESPSLAPCSVILLWCHMWSNVPCLRG